MPAAAPVRRFMAHRPAVIGLGILIARPELVRLFASILRREADAIDDQLLNLEALALQNHSAIGAGFAYPVTIEQVGRWANDIGARGYQLAPASAVLNARAARR